MLGNLKNLTLKNFHYRGFRYLPRMIYFGKTRFIYTVRTLLLESTADSWEGLMKFLISKTKSTLSNSLPSLVTRGEKYAEIEKHCM